MLDSALLRPGRFDRRVSVERPDRMGREQILRVHIERRQLPLGDDVSVGTVASSTVGFTGADLANLVNEAALLAGRDNKGILSWPSYIPTGQTIVHKMLLLSLDLPVGFCNFWQDPWIWMQGQWAPQTLVAPFWRLWQAKMKCASLQWPLHLLSSSITELSDFLWCLAGTVEAADFDHAILRAVAGIEKKRSILVGLEKAVVAKHEAGHALVSTAVQVLIPTSAPVEKLSIIPRTGGALGFTYIPPNAEDRALLFDSELRGQMAMLMGGRAAEELTCGQVDAPSECLSCA